MAEELNPDAVVLVSILTMKSRQGLQRSGMYVSGIFSALKNLF